MGNTKEKKLETLKKKLDEVETKNFMNKIERQAKKLQN